MKKKLKKIISKSKKNPEDLQPDGITPRITNENVASHREEVIGSAKKYIYPLQHSKHKIVIISVTLFVVGVIAFFSYTLLSLYRFKSSSSFLYAITKVMPFPVAKVGSEYVSYENYLFELRHYIHYYESQQKLDFKTEAGKQQLEDYKKRALNKVIDDAIVKEMADKNGVTVSDKELEEQIEILRKQNRLGSSEKGLEDVLKENFGWSMGDFKRSLRQQMLAQKVAYTLDTDTANKAESVYEKLKAGTDFAKAAKAYSDDANTKDKGGEYPALIEAGNLELDARVVQALFKLKQGETSDVINTGFTLEIVKNLDKQGDKIRAAHIVFKIKDVNTYINELKEQQKASTYIKF